MLIARGQGENGDFPDIIVFFGRGTDPLVIISGDVRHVAHFH